MKTSFLISLLLLLQMTVFPGCVEQFFDTATTTIKVTTTTIAKEKIIGCGEVDITAIFLSKSPEDRQKLSCLEENIINCKPAKLTVKGNLLSFDETSIDREKVGILKIKDFQVKGVNKKTCVISATLGKRITTCNIPPRVIREARDELKGSDTEGQIMVSLLLAMDQSKYTTKKGEIIKVNCNTSPPLTKGECEQKGTQLERDECYSRLAKEKENYTFCEEIEEVLKRDFCYKDLAILTENIELCEMMENEGLRKTSCYLPVAKVKGNATLCEKKLEGYEKEVCLEGVAITRNDPNLCGRIEDSGVRRECYKLA